MPPCRKPTRTGEFANLACQKNIGYFLTDESDYHIGS